MIFQNFPQTREQAATFDEITDGLHLAVVFERPAYELGEDASQKLVAKSETVADYYDERVRTETDEGTTSQIQNP